MAFMWKMVLWFGDCTADAKPRHVGHDFRLEKVLIVVCCFDELATDHPAIVTLTLIQQDVMHFHIFTEDSAPIMSRNYDFHCNRHRSLTTIRTHKTLASFSHHQHPAMMLVAQIAFRHLVIVLEPVMPITYL
jgi:hypothetical protein